MHAISTLSAAVVRRDFAFSLAAVAVAVLALAGEPAFAFRAGAVLLILLALTMEVKARVYHRILSLTTCEVWRVLDPATRPPEPLAHALIVRAMRRELRLRADATVMIALAMLLVGAATRVLSGG